jgi:hypothetical protein
MLDSSSSNNIDKLFNYLDEFRQLPAYQLERRADIFFAFYLKEILANHFPEVIIDSFIPEFPIKIDSITSGGNSSNLSNKVDYLAVSMGSKKIFLIELKTNTTSLRTLQHEYLIKAKKYGLIPILQDLITINKASRHKQKYAVLFQHLKELKLIDDTIKPIFESEFTIEIVYIIPAINERNKALLAETTLITFNSIIGCLNHHSDELTQRFIKSLANWIPVSK